MNTHVASSIYIVDIDECTVVNCNTTTSTGCTDLINDYQCDCEAGWSGKDCETSKIPKFSTLICGI